jgi:GNAT superfamily N-acetyltransferase
MKVGSEIAPAQRLSVRRARFEDGAALLRLIEGALEAGCRDHYSPPQRRAVLLTYAESLFVDLVSAVDTLVAEGPSGLVGVAQLDPGPARLRALFVAATEQGHGLGRTLLACTERLARAHGLTRLHGAMSRNAVPFYAHCGYQPCGGTDRLIRSGVVVPVTSMEKQLAPRAWLLRRPG